MFATLARAENSLLRQSAASLLGVAILPGTLLAQSIEVPNGSFESPKPPLGYPVALEIDNWQKAPSPQPDDGSWNNFAGAFPNPPASRSDHIDNVTGNQAAYLLSIPGVGLSQTLTATFEVGNSYALSIDALGGGGISEGSILQFGLFYLDNANSLSPIAVKPITYAASAFPNPTHLYSFEALSALVAATDPWAGKQIGIGLLNTFGTGAGYWDVDNVRLTIVPEPSSLALAALGIGTCLVFRTRSGRRS